MKMFPKGRPIGVAALCAVASLKGVETTKTPISLSCPFRSTGGKGTVLNGIDVLVRSDFALLKGKRIGLITNQTGQDRDRHKTIDLLHDAPGVTLVALFSPEHGIRGELDDKVGDAQDEKTGLPIHSLYGESRKPSAEQLKNLDALVYDIQDVGCRFYTYPSTLGLAIEAAVENGKQIYVLDRVNPLSGTMMDGP